MTVLRREHALVVAAEGNGYVIEPARFDLGLTRVEMVDYQLEQVLASNHPSPAVIEALLDARLEFTAEGQPAPA